MISNTTVVPSGSSGGLNLRARRVYLLAVGIVLLSAADLSITLAFLRANWMMEANPIAAYLIETTRSPMVLTAYKFLTVFICVALLLKLRHYAAGEIAAWCAVGILTIMSVMWHHYSRHFDDQQHLILAQSNAGDEYRLGIP
jgi:hypothetical protein